MVKPLTAMHRPVG